MRSDRAHIMATIIPGDSKRTVGSHLMWDVYLCSYVILQDGHQQGMIWPLPQPSRRFPPVQPCSVVLVETRVFEERLPFHMVMSEPLHLFYFLTLVSSFFFPLLFGVKVWVMCARTLYLQKIGITGGFNLCSRQF